MEVRGQEPLEYSLWLRPQGLAYVIREEVLSQKRGSDSAAALAVPSFWWPNRFGCSAAAPTGC
jgi:hypothetical protein